MSTRLRQRRLQGFNNVDRRLYACDLRTREKLCLHLVGAGRLRCFCCRELIRTVVGTLPLSTNFLIEPFKKTFLSRDILNLEYLALKNCTRWNVSSTDRPRNGPILTLSLLFPQLCKEFLCGGLYSPALTFSPENSLCRGCKPTSCIRVGRDEDLI